MREKVLASLFAFALVLVWGSWQLDRQSLVKQKHTEARIREDEQRRWLDEGPNYRATFENQKAQIDLESLPTRDEVNGQIDAVVRRFFSDDFSYGDPRTEQGIGMNFHTFQPSLNKKTYGEIKRFTQAIKAELPYLSLERMTISAQGPAAADPRMDVRYTFKSIEYTK